MRTIDRAGLVLGLATFAVLAAPAPAAAYVGPGATLAVIGAALAVIGAIFVTIAGFVWYPLKRAWRATGGRAKSSGEASGEVDAPETERAGVQP